MIWYHFHKELISLDFVSLKGTCLLLSLEFCFTFCCLMLVSCCFLASPGIHDRTAAWLYFHMRDWGVPNKDNSQMVHFCPDCVLRLIHVKTSFLLHNRADNDGNVSPSFVKISIDCIIYISDWTHCNVSHGTVKMLYISVIRISDIGELADLLKSQNQTELPILVKLLV